jgi:hypothetical protein
MFFTLKLLSNYKIIYKGYVAKGLHFDCRSLIRGSIPP